MKETVLRKTTKAPHGARYGAPAGVDEIDVHVTRHESGGQVYLTETVSHNGVVTYCGQYPADTEYARKRLARLEGGAA